MPDDGRRLVLPRAEPSRTGPPTWVLRLLAGLGVVPLTGLSALLAVGLTGWGVETTPAAQFRHDLPTLVAGAILGAACGAALGFALAGLRGLVIVPLTALGVVPAVVVAAASFTTSF